MRMFRRASFIGMAALVQAAAQGQVVVSAELLDPSDGAAFAGMPANLRVADIFIDVADTDVWAGGGIRAIAENGATIAYFDSDDTTPGVQPGLTNVGVANKFLTSLSQPRPRNGNGRFNNSGAAVSGAFNPPAPAAVTTFNELNVAFTASPPATDGSPAVDGFVARIAVDISGMGGVPSDYAVWGVGPISSFPAGSIVALRSAPFNASHGTESTTFDIPQPSGADWALGWVVPEPASGAMLLAAIACMYRRRA